MRYFLVLQFIINVLTLHSLSLSKSSYIDIPTANFNDGIFINLNGNYPIRTEGDVEFDPNVGIEFFYKRINAVIKWYDGADFALDLSYQISQENEVFPALSVGINDITNNKYISPVGSEDETYEDEKYLPRPPEIASAYLVASKKLNENIELTAGVGRGRFIGYGPRSKNVNFDVFFDDKHENVVLGLFGGLKYTMFGGFSFVIEGDGRDANIGVQYETERFKGTLGVTKVEQFFTEEGSPLTPRVDLSLSMKLPTFKRVAKGNLEIFLFDTKSSEPLFGRLILKNGKEKVLPISMTGRLSYKINPGNYMLQFNSPNYREKNLKLSITSNETKKIFVDMVREHEVIIEEEEEVVAITDIKGAIEDIRVKFTSNEFSFSPVFYGVLDRIAEVLEDHPNVGLTIIGHSDSIGSSPHNQTLSEERALSVKIYLISEGIAPERLITTGYGETRPIADNGTEEGRAENRRVEFIIIPFE